MSNINVNTLILHKFTRSLYAQYSGDVSGIFTSLCQKENIAMIKVTDYRNKVTNHRGGKWKLFAVFWVLWLLFCGSWLQLPQNRYPITAQR